MRKTYFDVSIVFLLGPGPALCALSTIYGAKIADCPLRDWYDWLIRVWPVDKGCIIQLNRLGDLGNKLCDLLSHMFQNYPNHPSGAAPKG